MVDGCLDLLRQFRVVSFLLLFYVPPVAAEEPNGKSSQHKHNKNGNDRPQRHPDGDGLTTNLQGILEFALKPVLFGQRVDGSLYEALLAHK